jgi:hypothetical protein
MCVEKLSPASAVQQWRCKLLQLSSAVDIGRSICTQYEHVQHNETVQKMEPYADLSEAIQVQLALEAGELVMLEVPRQDTCLEHIHVSYACNIQTVVYIVTKV